MSSSVIIYDGNCGFCNQTVLFIAKKDVHDNFSFVASLSELGKELLLQNKIEGLEKSTLILIENDKLVYTRGTALRKIILKLPNYKIIGYLMYLFPTVLTNFIYNVLSKNRKKIMKNNNCEIPTLEIRTKFRN
tara:strand:- start:61 stop:459 length:399 start_codon:yes stop_codon:yes gene_type:complete